MSLINWGTSGEGIENRFNNMIERMFDSPRARSLAERFETDLNPSIEVTENDNEFNVHADLPGMKKEDINVDIDGDTLTFSGETKSHNDYKDENVRYSERRYGHFSRSVPVPENVDKNKISAAFHDGVLDLKLPKSSKQASKAKKINVK